MDKKIRDKVLKNFQKAVREAIQYNHSLGLPVYQREGDYIVAIYPHNRKVRLEKLQALDAKSKPWYLPH